MVKGKFLLNSILMIVTLTVFSEKTVLAGPQMASASPQSVSCPPLVSLLTEDDSGLDQTQKEELRKNREKIKTWNELVEDRQTPVDEKVIQEAKAAIPAFTAYIKSVKSAVIEGDPTIDATLMALLGQRNVLIVGSPGNAKSMVAELMLKNITFGSDVAKNISAQPIQVKRDITKGGSTDGTQGRFTSLFKVQITSETTFADVFGSLDTAKLMNQGIRVRRLEQGAVEHVYVFLDELFDGAPQLLRALLNLMNERTLSEGGITHQAATQTIVATSNYYLPEVYKAAQKMGINLEAVMDRFSYIVFVPKEFANTGNPTGATEAERLGSTVQMLKGALDKKGYKIEPLKYEDLAKIQNLTKEVEVPELVLQILEKLSKRANQKLSIKQTAAAEEFNRREQNGENPPPPYRQTKLFTKRFLVNASLELRNIVAMGWIEKGGDRPLVVNFNDILALKHFMTEVGPTSGDLDKLISEADQDPREKSALETLKIEREAVVDAWKEIVTEFEAEISRYM